MTTLEYKGFRIEVTSVGKGWRASIFEPGSNRALADSPLNLEKSRSEEIVAEASRIIDARLAPPRRHYSLGADLDAYRYREMVQCVQGSRRRIRASASRRLLSLRCSSFPTS
jgi:hypothetical protein